MKKRLLAVLPAGLLFAQNGLEIYAAENENVIAAETVEEESEAENTGEENQ